MTIMARDAAPAAPHRRAVATPPNGNLVWTAHPHAPRGDRRSLLTALVSDAGERRLAWTDPMTGDWWHETVPVPETLDDSLAILAPRLAIAIDVHAAWVRRDPTATALLIDPYDTIGFLVHQLVAESSPAIDVSAQVAGRIQAEIAEAFGATTVHATDPAVRVHGAPTAPRVRTALILLDTQRWRFAPGVTLAASEREWRAAIDADAVGYGLEAVVHP